MAGLAVDGGGVAGQGFGADADVAGDAARQRGAALVEMEMQRVAVPVQGARSDGEEVGAAFGAGALGHRPAGARTVESDVERAMAERVGGAAAPRPAIPGREYAAQKGDQGKAVAAILAERVDVPPEIAVGADEGVEARSSIRADAARRPDKAAIGTPGPGWVLPPAR